MPKKSVKFKKFPSISNNYNKKDVEYWLSNYTELYDTKYVLEEKVDGSNFQITFKNKGEVKFAKRSGYLNSGENFFDWENSISRYKDFLDSVKSWLKTTDYDYIRLYGEYYGMGIQKRISYSQERNFIFYDVIIDGEWKTRSEIEKIFKEIGYENLLVPIVATFDTIEECLNFDVENIQTQVGDPKFDLYRYKFIEGVVIKPYDKNVINNNNEPFRIKKKTKKFIDKKNKSSVKKQKDYSDNFNRVLGIYSRYFNENRVADVMGKYGEIKSSKQIGEYIKYVMEDVKEDFFKENNKDFMSLEPNEKKFLFKQSGKLSINLIRKYLL